MINRVKQSITVFKLKVLVLMVKINPIKLMVVVCLFCVSGVFAEMGDGSSVCYSLLEKRCFRNGSDYVCFDENETGKMACYCAKLDNSDDKNGIQCQRTTSSSEGAAVRYRENF